MKNKKILLTFIILSGLSYFGLCFFRVFLFETQPYVACHVTFMDALLKICFDILVLISLKNSKTWILNNRTFLLLGSIIWPFLDGVIFLNDITVYDKVDWSLDVIVLAGLLVTSLVGFIAAFRCAHAKERETIFIFSLIIGAIAIWEYTRFGNFGDFFFLVEELMIITLLKPEKHPGIE